MKVSGRTAWSPAPEARVSCTRAVSLPIPTCRNVAPAFPTLENFWHDSVCLVLYLFRRTFCPLVDVRLQPCTVAAPGVYGKLAGIEQSRNSPTVGCSYLQNTLLPDPVPEPISMIFFGTGLVAVGGYVSRRRMLRKV